MAKSSIRPETDGVQHEHLPATQAPASVAVHDRQDYDSDKRDTIIPRLGVINKIGPLSELFPRNAGEFAFEKRLVLGTAIAGGAMGESEITVIPLAFRKSYIEVKREGNEIKFGEILDPPARVFATANDAHHAGYAIDYDSTHPNKVEEAGEIIFLVAGPADDPAESFFIQIGDQHFAPALFNCRRGTFRDVYRNIKTWSSRPGAKIHGKICTLRSTLQKNPVKGQAWFEARIQVRSKLDDASIAAIEEAVPAFLSEVRQAASPAAE